MREGSNYFVEQVLTQAYHQPFAVWLTACTVIRQAGATGVGVCKCIFGMPQLTCSQQRTAQNPVFCTGCSHVLMPFVRFVTKSTYSLRCVSMLKAGANSYIDVTL